MPISKIGKKTPMDKRNPFIRLKAKGEKAHFRIASREFYYDGKHFNKTATGWDVTDCPRIMHEEDCETCNIFFEMKKQAKQDKSEKKKEQLNKDARNFAPKISFYYKVLDRDTHEAKILQTALSVRLKIDQELNNGIDVLKYDYILTRTEKLGGDYYALTRLDSKQTEPLTEEEKQALEEAKNIDFETNLKKSSKELKAIDPFEEEINKLDEKPY